MKQVEMFDVMLSAYAESEALSNTQLYQRLSAKCNITEEQWNERKVVDHTGIEHSVLKRKTRWWQQSLRELGLLERVEGQRGVWRVTPKGRGKLNEQTNDQVLVGFSTDLGIALWCKAESFFPHLGESIDLCLSSLPYPLKNQRDYGNPSEHEYVDWASRLLEPIIKQLNSSASLVLNLGNDIFESGLPSRSLYRERLMIALSERFGLHLMDNLVWHNPCRPPGPLRWASVSRQQLNAKTESIYWLSPDPLKCKADNRRVLEPHSDQHLKLMRSGGEKRSASYGDGAHKVREGAYARMTDGKIPGNLISMSHRCKDKISLQKLVKEMELPIHGATMPLKLAQFLIEFLTEKNDLVVDPCSGWARTAKAAELTGRRWAVTEKMAEYVIGGAMGMREFPGFEMFGRWQNDNLQVA